MVETDLAELVDQHRGVGKPPPAQQPLQNRRLARAEKAGDQGDRVNSGIASAKLGLHPGNQILVERIAWPANEPLGRRPERREVVDHLGLTGRSRQYERAALPVDQRDPIVLKVRFAAATRCIRLRRRAALSVLRVKTPGRGTASAQ